MVIMNLILFIVGAYLMFGYAAYIIITEESKRLAYYFSRYPKLCFIGCILIWPIFLLLPVIRFLESIIDEVNYQ